MDYQLLLHLMKQLEQQMASLHHKIENLQTRMRDLENQQKNQTTIEKIEYNFDQLKIEQLDGMLQIGLSPEQLNKLDEFTVPNPNAPITSKIEEQLQAYIDEELPVYMRELEKKYDYPLSNEQHQLLVNDIQQQVKDRIAYYLPSYNETTFNHDQMKDAIVKEIEKGIDTWFYNQAENRRG